VTSLPAPSVSAQRLSERTVKHEDVSSAPSTLSGYETLHSTETLICPSSLITYPLKSVRLEYYLTLRHNVILWRFGIPGIMTLFQRISVILQ
jgi:hypothetical protein